MLSSGAVPGFLNGSPRKLKPRGRENGGMVFSKPPKSVKTHKELRKSKQ
jgi:hypothetical protein